MGESVHSLWGSGKCLWKCGLFIAVGGTSGSDGERLN